MIVKVNAFIIRNVNFSYGQLYKPNLISSGMYMFKNNYSGKSDEYTITNTSDVSIEEGWIENKMTAMSHYSCD